MISILFNYDMDDRVLAESLDLVNRPIGSVQVGKAVFVNILIIREVSLALHQERDTLPDSERSHAVMQVRICHSS